MMDRRKMIKLLGLGMASYQLPLQLNGGTPTPIKFERVENPNFKIPEKPVTAITLGAGARGNVYGNFAKSFPDLLNIVGVAEPIAIRRERYVQKHEIPSPNQFESWGQVFEQPKFADAIIITTPDDLHYGPCMRALQMGYDILLEKPIAPTAEECRDILELSLKTNRIVAVCHVLRYAPYFQKMQALLRSGAIGNVISMQHFEPIEHIHMAHSFVRGNWHNSKHTAPIILAKSCHDMDIMRWLIDQPAKRISAFGNLSWFNSSNAPAGSTDRCTDGCPAEQSCPYSALNIYYRKRHYTYVFDLPDSKAEQGEAILSYLKQTNYGRCVYKMENDQPDHYVCAMEFDKGITASFNMEAFTSYHGRKTRIMGSKGDIVGDMSQFVWHDFLTGEEKIFDNKVEEVENYSNSGHGGGDWRLVADWVMAVSQQNKDLLSSGIEASIESHLMAFAAERSRLKGQMETVL